METAGHRKLHLTQHRVKKVEHLTFLTDYGGQTMSSQTSLVAEQVRLQQWAAQIQECQSRPADMNVETWCSEHGITKANYYYRLRRVRKACLEACNPEPAFVKLPIPAALPTAMPSADSCNVKPAAVLRNSRGLVLEIYNHTSADIIRSILEVLVHVE